MNRTVPSSLGAEAQAVSVGSGLCRVGQLFFLQELIHGGAPAVYAGKTSPCA